MLQVGVIIYAEQRWVVPTLFGRPYMYANIRLVLQFTPFVWRHAVAAVLLSHAAYWAHIQTILAAPCHDESCAWLGGEFKSLVRGNLWAFLAFLASALWISFNSELSQRQEYQVDAAPNPGAPPTASAALMVAARPWAHGSIRHASPSSSTALSVP